VDLTQAIYDALSGDATLVSLLSTYGGASPSAPAIFTEWPVPEDAARPYVVSEGEVVAVPFDELSDGGSPTYHLGIDVLRDVYVFTDKRSGDDVEAIARRIRTVLHKQPLTIPDGSHIMTRCVSGPVPAPTDDTLRGRVLTFRIVAMEA